MSFTLVVVDDDPLQLKLATRRLELAGYTVRPAADGTQALALIREQAPDAVVSDVVMPGLDGFALCDAIRKDATISHVPVLLITNSSPDGDDRMLALRSGAKDLITRTPDFAEVCDALAALVTQRSVK